jgi:hypothetical protein
MNSATLMFEELNLIGVMVSSDIDHDGTLVNVIVARNANANANH